MTPRPRDEGSVLVLSLGFIIICIIALAVVVDASTVFLARRALQSQADGAALAGAQAMDLNAYYSEGASERIRLDEASVRAAVDRHVRRDPGDGRLTGVTMRDDVVLVTMTDRVRPPFSGWLTPSGAYPLTVEAGAVLSYRPAG